MPDNLDRLKTALAERYAIQEELGAGGMATVYLAEDLKHHRKVAVKVLRPELAATLGPERFLREIEIAANLQHPHILPLYDSGQADAFLYYVMPYVKGESLREKLHREGELPVTEAVLILREVVDALDHAHGEGIVHRDIKPDNVMLSGRHALVTDFGVAKAVSEATGRQQLTTAGVALGTPTYMAPEQAAASQHIDQRADIYAVGAMAYEMLTARPPFVGATPQEVLAAHVTQAPDPVTKYREHVPEALSQIVARCLEKKPADRWQSAADLLPQLEPFTTPDGGIPPTGMQPTAVVVGRRRVFGAIAVVVVLAAVTIGVWPLTRDGGSGLVSNRVAVAPFVNRTTEASLDHLGNIASDWVQRGLLQTEVLEVLATPPSFAADSASALRAFAGAAGASLLVSGTYYHSRDSIYFQADIIDVTDGALRGALDPIGGERDDPMQPIELLRQLIMSAVVQLSGGELALQVFGTGRPPKYEAYREAIAAGNAYIRGDFQAMKEHGHKAWSLDTTYVFAQLYAANGHWLLGEWAEVDSILRLVEQSAGRLTASDRWLAEWFQAYLDGDLQAAAHATKRLIQVAPSPQLIRESGFDALFLNRPRETVEILSNYDPKPLAMIGEPLYWGILSAAHNLLGNYDEAQAVAQEGRTLFPNDGWF